MSQWFDFDCTIKFENIYIESTVKFIKEFLISKCEKFSYFEYEVQSNELSGVKVLVISYHNFIQIGVDSNSYISALNDLFQQTELKALVGFVAYEVNGESGSKYFGKYAIRLEMQDLLKEVVSINDRLKELVQLNEAEFKAAAAIAF